MSYSWPPSQQPPEQEGAWPPPSYPPQRQGFDSGGYGSWGGPAPASRPAGWPPEPAFAPSAAPPSQYPQYPQYPQYQPSQNQGEQAYGYGPSGPYGPYGPYDAPPPPVAHTARPRRNWLLGLVLVIACLLVVAGGAYALSGAAGRTKTPSAQRTPGATAATHPYSSNAIGVQFSLPNGWTTQDQAAAGGQGMQATSPDGTAALVAASFPYEGGNEAGAANGALAGVADSGKVDNKEGPTNAAIAGTTWVREAGDVTRSGTRFHMVVYVTTHNHHAYLLAFMATTSAFASADARYFQPVAQSFRFLA